MAYPLVQEVHDFTYPATGQPVLVMPGNITKGNLLVAWVSSVSPTNQVISDAVNSFRNVQINSSTAFVLPWKQCKFQQAGGYGKVSMWYCVARKTGPLSIQFYDANLTLSGGLSGVPANLAYPAVQLMEFSGASLNVLDTASFASGTGVTPAS